MMVIKVGRIIVIQILIASGLNLAVGYRQIFVSNSFRIQNSGLRLQADADGTSFNDDSEIKTVSNLDSNGVPSRPYGEIMQSGKQITRIAAATMTTLSTLLMLQSKPSYADSALYPSAPKAASRPKVYSVEMTDPPSLQPRTTRGEEGAINRFADADILLHWVYADDP